MSKGERRLAAIMYTDMIGYTALGQRDESLSLALVEEQRNLLRPIFKRHNGREVKTMGDAFLVEFPSALDAVRCAYDIQRAIREFNISLPSEKRVRLRVGVHLGDVVEFQGDISGDAVNVASRIEPLAEDGGVCLTRQVYDHVQNKFELPLVSLGSKSLKNVSAPMEIYRMMMPWEEENVPSTGFSRKRIAILPFTSLSPDAEDVYFADGMTEELISTISNIGQFSVISRTSVMGYKGTSKKVREIGRELEVGSLLEGSVRKSGSKIRITVQLISVKEDEHLWSRSYDRELNDVFALQCEIATKVAETLQVELADSERARINKPSTESIDAYTLYLKGRFYWNQRTKYGMDSAVAHFEEAIRQAPEFALAYSALADCYGVYSDFGWQKPDDSYPKAKECALKAIGLDPTLAEPHASLGLVLGMYEFNWSEAEKEFKRALELKASYATAHHWYSVQLRIMDRLDESLEQIRQAAELDPLSRIIRQNVGEQLLAMGCYKEGAEQLERLVAGSPEYASARCYLAWAYFLESETDRAMDEMRKAVSISGHDPFYEAAYACLLGLAGRRGDAAQAIERLGARSKVEYVDEATIAFALFGAGRVDEAFSHLEEAYAERSHLLLYFRTMPWLREFWNDPRWGSLESRLGLQPG